MATVNNVYNNDVDIVHCIISLQVTIKESACEHYQYSSLTIIMMDVSYILLSLLTVNTFVFLWHGISPYYRIKFGQSNLSREIPVIVSGLFRAVLFYIVITAFVAVVGLFQKAYLIIALLMLGVLVLVGVSLVVCVKAVYNVTKKAFSSL